MLKKALALWALVPAVAFAAPAQKMVDSATSKITWTGSKEFVGGSHTGTVNLANGFLMMDGDKITGGEFVIDMNSMQNTDLTDPGMKEKLVGHLKSPDFFDVANHKDAKFVITKVTATSPTSQVFEGNLTLRGKTQAMRVPATLKKEGSVWTATGTIDLDRTKFDVKYNSKTFVPDLVKSAKDKVIKNNIVIEFNVKTMG
jgi:polyisoprenoid-binding protein YceI